MSSAGEEGYIRRLVERGLSELEAKELFASEVLAGTTFHDGGLECNTITAPTMMVAFGKVSE